MKYFKQIFVHPTQIALLAYLFKIQVNYQTHDIIMDSTVTKYNKK